MQNVPKIVQQRLRTTKPAVSHPDANVLTAFAERSLPEVERAAVLEHMARCGDCRDIVALALPESDPVEAVVRPSPNGWTWPVLRWGFVAASVAAIATFGVIQFQRHSQTASAGLKQSPSLEVAANEPKKQELARFADAVPSENREKLQTPAAPVFTDSVGTKATRDDSEKDKKTVVALTKASPAPAVASATGGRSNSFHGAVAGQLSHGPRLANQWPQQNLNSASNQASSVPPPSAFAKQQSSYRMATRDQNMDLEAAARPPSTPGDAVPSIARAKAAPIPSGTESATVQSSINQAVAGLRVQGAPGQLRGNVVDPTGAAVANARITIIPADKGASATAVTDSAGTWIIAGLPSGSYKAQAEAPGFKTSVLALNYDADKPSMYSLTLNVGSVAETVEVAAQNGQVQTESPTVGGPISNRQVSQIPTNGRSFDLLSALAPVAWSITSTGGLQRSVDHGRSWQTVDVNAGPPSFSNSTSVEIVSKASKATKAKASAKGAGNQNSGPVTFRAVVAAGSDVWAGGNAGVLYHSVDSGSHWTRVAPASAGAALTGDIISVNFPDAQHGSVATSTSEVWNTSDSGQTWQKQ